MRGSQNSNDNPYGGEYTGFPPTPLSSGFVQRWTESQNSMVSKTPKEHSATSGDILSHNWGELLVSSRQRPRIILNILQCTRQPPARRIIQSTMSTVPRLRNTGAEELRKGGPVVQKVWRESVISLDALPQRHHHFCKAVWQDSENWEKTLTFYPEDQ